MYTKKICCLFSFLIIAFSSCQREDKTIIKKTYYPSGDLKETIPYKDSLMHGEYKSYFQNGNIRTEFILKNGEKEGTVKEYFENGRLRIKGQYSKNLEEGLFYVYSKKGQIEAKLHYRQGNRCLDSYVYYPNGLMKNYLFYGASGEVRYVRGYDSVGNTVKDEGNLISFYLFKNEYSNNVNLVDTFKCQVFVARPPNTTSRMHIQFSKDGGIFAEKNYEVDTNFVFIREKFLNTGTQVLFLKYSLLNEDNLDTLKVFRDTLNVYVHPLDSLPNKG